MQSRATETRVSMAMSAGREAETGDGEVCDVEEDVASRAVSAECSCAE
jgi:hypothetical protein